MTDVKQGKWGYPAAHQGDVVDHYHGVSVPDPYRWLEDVDNEATAAWTQAQHDLAKAYLQKLPGREALTARLTDLWNFPRYSAPNRRGKYLFFTKNDGLQNQPSLYVQEGDSEPRLLLDPNTFSTDGTIALVGTSPTKDGSLIAYATSDGGSDWITLHVRDVKTGQDLPDVIENVKFSGATWLEDNSGFFYSTFPPGADDATENNQVVFHRMFFHETGTSQASDESVYARPDLPGSIFGTGLSDDGQYLITYVGGESVSNCRLYYHRIGGEDFVRTFDALDADYVHLHNVGKTLYIQTTKDAPRKRIVAVDMDKPDPANWRDIIPQADDVIAFAVVVNGQLVIAYLHDASHQIKIYDLDGKFVRDVPLPAVGSIFELTGEPGDSEFFILFTSFLYPPSILRYDFKTDTLSPFFPQEVPFNSQDYQTSQVFYKSKDGTRVPMFITHRKGIVLDGTHPTILYGYGGYTINMTPGYINWLPAWLERGGIYVMANLRGGAEYGEEWHRGGMLESKQNTFDDFMAAAEHLIASGYTSAVKLAIEGGSNGGLLVAACMLQRPELIGAVLCHVPVIDMLRFQHFTAGRYWTSEYGDANSSKEHFDFLIKYSPLHNVKAGVVYPPVLIMTADHDDRVVPMHSKKFAAALQAANPANLTLLRIDIRAGHGFGKPTGQQIDQRVDVLAFLAEQFGMKA